MSEHYQTLVLGDGKIVAVTEHVDVDRITFPHFRAVGWSWNGEVHYFMSEQASTNEYPNPGELVAKALNAPPPEAATE